ncbi:hypothetical protein C8R44DRAFT_423280 [Mycena epipterygia]|nr:hypothetical protein C8R44DRAFT_423280 [Mycena epipterygia]
MGTVALRQKQSPGIIALIDSKDGFMGDLPLGATDFPPGWVSGQHPEDYQALAGPLTPLFFMTDAPQHVRLWYRVSFKIRREGAGEGEYYMPMSFLVDTGAPASLYLGKTARELLMPERLGKDHRMSIGGAELDVTDTPPNLQPANIVGLGLISRFGLGVEGKRWSWMRPLEYW